MFFEPSDTVTPQYNGGKKLHREAHVQGGFLTELSYSHSREAHVLS